VLGRGEVTIVESSRAEPGFKKVARKKKKSGETAKKLRERAGSDNMELLCVLRKDGGA